MWLYCTWTDYIAETDDYGTVNIAQWRSVKVQSIMAVHVAIVNMASDNGFGCKTFLLRIVWAVIVRPVWLDVKKPHKFWFVLHKMCH